MARHAIPLRRYAAVRSKSADLRIIIDNGEYSVQNKGDLAMLDVTVGRLRERWPTARVGVLTYNPALLRAYEERAEPLSFSEGGGWESNHLLRRLPGRLPPRVVAPSTRVWQDSSEPARRIARRVRAGLLGGRGPTPARTTGVADNAASQRRLPPRVPRGIETASLVLALGGGYMADVDPDQVHRTLDLLERAVELGVPTAMVGQGVGPLEDSELLARARRILPSVDFIALRERCNGPALLKSLDVDDDRVTVTGDDAIEMAYGLRSENVGSGFGVCLRIAPYSPVAGAATEAIRRALHTCAEVASASLVPMAVSEYQSEDRRSTLPLTTGYANVVPMLSRHSSARDLARRVSTCRVVVTGAYHLAVFALSQGIPVVAMSSSRYYDHKFIGLRDMFQCGVSTVKLETNSLEQRLSDAILAASAEAPAIRERLLDAAQRQIRTSRAAYDRVYELVEKPERAPEP